MFLFLPTFSLIGGAFTDRAGNFTFENIAGLFTDQILSAYWISIRISGASALLGALIGLAITLAIIRGKLPSGLRSAVMTFCGVASNFAGVPLAFAFLSTLGRLGLITVLLRDWFGINLYATGFNLLSFTGLTLTYMYFQIPLMVLIITPALEGMRKEWREAAESLGATHAQYWLKVALPILLPSLAGAFVLLFANSFARFQLIC
jgi:putative spermidine/putrescine transport system permease protein